MRMWRLFGASMMAIVFWSASCKDAARGTVSAEPTKNPTELTVAFFNVENIFDIYNDPEKNDNDFTPTGKLQWSEDRYQMKLAHIAEAISLIDSELPDVMGLCEVENRKVVEDLISTSALKEAGYGIVHYDSPDERGIDVAFIYKIDEVQVISSKNIKVKMPTPGDKTRDILYVEAKVHGQNIHFFVNHWPSRSGGQSESEPNRLAAAAALKKAMDAVRKNDPDARIISMGDFNDHPNDKSITEGIGANGNEKATYVDLMAPLHSKGVGSYWYKGEWGALDQFIVSRATIGAVSGWMYEEGSAGFLNDDKVMFTDSKGVKRPSRTYVGDDYKAGYSDHLAARMKLIWK